MKTFNPELRRQVIAVYKGPSLSLDQASSLTSRVIELLFLGREYPLGFDYFRPRLHKAFISKAAERDEDKIRQGIAQAEYVKKEIEAL
ncbi:hypothetical protein FZEAL_7113 [Fusarium zealandicum]|uniref:Uncharacterized protein n=1 Tax=Fusarium zealandicum TaxID=1053134 RepID=A0A8H4XIY3_9HYPO|nr:hypothetical protein FZEAL_7113 [Fusarium zealandicum]